MLCSLRSDRVFSLSRGKGSIKGAETCPTVIYLVLYACLEVEKSCATYFAPAAPQGAQLNSVNEACIHCFCPVCVSAAPCFDFGLAGVLGIAFGGFLIGVLLIGALWFIKIKTGKTTAQSWSINTGPIIMSRGIKLITFWFKQATQAGWTLAPLQQVSPVRLRFFRGFFLSPLYPLISFLLSFLQGVLAQERNANLFPPTLPPLRTAALTLASAAPRAHPPAAWHDYIWVTSSSRPPSSVKVSYVGFVSYWLMLEKHYCCPLCVLFKFSFKKHKPGLPWEPKMEVMWELVTKEWGEAPGLGGAHLWGRVKLLDRKLKRAVKKKGFQKQEKQTISPQEPPGNSPHSTRWIVLVWRQHNNSQAEDKPVKRMTLKNRWKAALCSHLCYKNAKCFSLARSNKWSTKPRALKRSTR